MRLATILRLSAFAFGSLTVAAASGDEPAPSAVATADFTVKDTARDRDIPIRVYLPAEKAPAPVVLFSHGLGGSRAASPYLCRGWASHGYAVVALQHPGSDDSVWKGVPPGGRMAEMNKAASPRNFLLRVRDVPAVLDRLAAWDEEEGHPLAHRLDLDRVGMSGHSFGAVTTQAVAGQSTPTAARPFADRRIKAAIALSPGGPRNGADPGRAFGDVKIPWMLMTGTKDTSPIGNADLASRLSVYPALPPGGKYELVLEKAEHSAFSERPLPGDAESRNPNHHRAIVALSLAFWDAYLKGDPKAKAWLDGDGPRSVLEPGDTWKWK